MIGPMEQTKAGDSGIGWRNKLKPELQNRIDKNGNPVYAFDPCAEEQSKIGMDTGTFHKKLKGWVNSGNNEKIAEGIDLIWRGKTYIEKTEEGHAKLVKILGDNDYTINSTFLVARMEEGDVPCVAKNSKILMADWSQKNIEEIKIGDKILGFQKFNRKIFLVESEVLNAQKTGHRKCIQIIDKKGNKIQVTENHKFLTKNKKCGSIYSEIKNIKNVFSLRNEPSNKDFLKGWLTGYLQHDGCFQENWRTHQVILVSNKIDEIERVKEILHLFNLSCTITDKINKESHNKIYKLTTNTRHDFLN
jgi:hypothetical protein